MILNPSKRCNQSTKLQQPVDEFDDDQAKNQHRLLFLRIAAVCYQHHQQSLKLHKVSGEVEEEDESPVAA
jgi:hypothetical protein